MTDYLLVSLTTFGIAERSGDSLEVQSARDNALRAVEEIKSLREAMNKFCDRVENGEIRSKVTYESFCDILKREKKPAPGKKFR